MKCEYCGAEHNGNYASGRFCSFSCSRKFNASCKQKIQRSSQIVNKEYICENCKTKHDGSYASGRFCSVTCAKGFRILENKEITRKKLSKAGLRRGEINRQKRLEAKKNRIFICENCGKEHDGNYASGRFCSYQCAKKFVGRKTPEQIRKISQSLKGRSPKRGFKRSAENKKNISQALKRKYFELYKNISFDELKPQSKRTRILFEQENLCAKCKNPFIWLGRELTPHLHHKDGNRSNEQRENLELLCPNCHSITENWGNHNRKLSRERRLLLHDQAIKTGLGKLIRNRSNI